MSPLHSISPQAASGAMALDLSGSILMFAYSISQEDEPEEKRIMRSEPRTPRPASKFRSSIIGEGPVSWWRVLKHHWSLRDVEKLDGALSRDWCFEEGCVKCQGGDIA